MKTVTKYICSRCGTEIKHGLILKGELSTIPDKEGFSETVYKSDPEGDAICESCINGKIHRDRRW